mmetsp:Transcript_63645/g.153699  ORF Transcript_63645/g.153699 Transcript_63645/m.153699 type:complete len:255 (+) Transcript_63645:68-832(+)
MVPASRSYWCCTAPKYICMLGSPGSNPCSCFACGARTPSPHLAALMVSSTFSPSLWQKPSGPTLQRASCSLSSLICASCCVSWAVQPWTKPTPSTGTSSTGRSTSSSCCGAACCCSVALLAACACCCCCCGSAWAVASGALGALPTDLMGEGAVPEAVLVSVLDSLLVEALTEPAGALHLQREAGQFAGVPPQFWTHQLSSRSPTDVHDEGSAPSGSPVRSCHESWLRPQCGMLGAWSQVGHPFIAGFLSHVSR